MPNEEYIELQPGDVTFNGSESTILKAEATTFLEDTLNEYGKAYVANELALLHNSNCKGATCNTCQA